MCTAKSRTGMDLKVIHIIVEAKSGNLHTAPLVIAPSIIHAKYYEQTSLNCNVTGYPTPSVVWQHNNKVIQSSGNTLVIPSVTNTTSGDYTCIATNDVGVSQAKIQLIYTYDAPKIVSPPTPFVVAAGQSHNFTCVATGHPKPAIKWEFHSFLDHGTNFPTHVTTQNGSLLTLVRMQVSGTLTCTAINQFGVDSSTVHVIVKNAFCPGDLCGHGHKPITYLSVGICICNPGYTGQCCEKDIDECISSRCIHGSTCIDGVNGYTCHCLSGYTGKYCQTDIDECSSSRCIHGSTCIDGVNGYTCHCLSGYTGKYCQTDIDECSSNPCQNYGICTERINGYTCRCPPGYTGQNCETNINECESNPCQHGGTCTDHLTLYTCTCAAGYFGKNCQINRQCHSNPCVNCGTCNDDQINGYTCKCHVGYTGHNCETVSPVTTVPEVILAPEKTINEGSGKEIIPCFANGIPDPIITWEALDGSLPSNAKQVTHYLYFENVTLLDEGHYMCTAKSMTGMDVKVIHIIVKAKPGKQHVAPLVTAPAIINVKYYTQTSLICNVTGYPTPSVIWKHYNKVIQSSGSTLVIPSVTNTTSGYYTCIATNDAGVSQANIQLIYTYDAPQIVSPPTSFVIAAGQSHNFTCVATGHPKPTIKWKFNSFVGHGTNLPPHVTTQNGSLLSLVRMQESGTLTCTARNEFGVDSSTVHVIVKHGSPAVG